MKDSWFTVVLFKEVNLSIAVWFILTVIMHVIINIKLSHAIMYDYHSIPDTETLI